MKKTLQTKVAKGRMVEGRWQEEPPNLGVAERRVALGPSKGRLHILVEVVGPEGREEISQEILELIAEEYFRVPGGITNGLRQGIRAANQFLYRKNREVAKGMPYLAGVSCVAISDDHFYMGQGGPALICLLQEGQMRTFPDLPWGEEGTSPPLPLGVEEQWAEVGLYHRRLEEGDVAILASPTLPELMSGQEFLEAVASRSAEAALANLARSARGGEFSALVIEALPEGEARKGPRAPRMADRALKGVGAIPSKVAASEIWGGLGQRLREGFSSLIQGMGTLTRRMLPEEYGKEPRPRPPARRARRKGLTGRQKRNLLLLSGALVIIGAGAFMGWNRWRGERAREAHFQGLVAQAEEKLTLARAEKEAAASRKLLGEVQLLLEEAKGLRPDHPEVQRLESGVYQELDQLSQVVRLPLRLALEFPEAQSQPIRVVAADNEVYILDGGLDRLYRYRWSEEGRTLQTPGEGAILIDSGEKGELLDIVWMEPDGGRGRGALLVVQRDGLLEYDPLQGLTPLTVVESESWREPRRAGSFEGNFYLLDPGAGRIFKYLPTGRDYNSSPLDYLLEAKVDLKKAVDMAIDGDIYILSENVVMKFTTGEREPFTLKGLEEPLSNPTALFTNSDTEHIYLVDSQRVVEIDKEGRFLRQFRPERDQEEAFQGLRGLFVDEGKGRLFILSGRNLYLADLPPK